MTFKNKVVLVTGASSGIGAAAAIKFAAEGAKVAIVGRKVDKLKNVTQKCIDSGSKPLTIVADMTKDEDLKRILTETISKFGKLDVLVNSVGIVGFISIFDKDVIQLFDQLVATNYRSVVFLTNLAAPYLVETKGNIVNVSSIGGMAVLTPATALYNSTKAGLDHFTRSVALEFAGKGVRVNSVNPGPVKTDILENVGMDSSASKSAFDDMAKSAPLKRFAEVEEVADLILYLASDKARSITGSLYVIDNGTLLAGSVRSLDKEMDKQ